MPTISIDVVDAVELYLSQQALEQASIVSSKSSAVNISVPNAKGDYVSLLTLSLLLFVIALGLCPSSLARYLIALIAIICLPAHHHRSLFTLFSFSPSFSLSFFRLNTQYRSSFWPNGTAKDSKRSLFLKAELGLSVKEVSEWAEKKREWENVFKSARVKCSLPAVFFSQWCTPAD